MSGASKQQTARRRTIYSTQIILLLGGRTSFTLLTFPCFISLSVFLRSYSIIHFIPCHQICTRKGSKQVFFTSVKQSSLLPLFACFDRRRRHRVLLPQIMCTFYVSNAQRTTSLFLLKCNDIILKLKYTATRKNGQDTLHWQNKANRGAPVL